MDSNSKWILLLVLSMTMARIISTQLVLDPLEGEDEDDDDICYLKEAREGLWQPPPGYDDGFEFKKEYMINPKSTYIGEVLHLRIPEVKPKP